ncbi:MAG: hypothetical protein ACK5ZJ_09080, partial [Acidobacteriota bacterium]
MQHRGDPQEGVGFTKLLGWRKKHPPNFPTIQTAGALRPALHRAAVATAIAGKAKQLYSTDLPLNYWPEVSDALCSSTIAFLNLAFCRSTGSGDSRRTISTPYAVE